MSIVYPLSLPTTIDPARVVMTAVNSSVISRSPFSFAEQVLTYEGQMWEANIEIAPCLRDDAEAWITFLLKLKGHYGTFMLGDYNGATARGECATTPGTPIVTSVGANLDTISLSGAPNSVTAYFRAGDYIQIGTSLHKVLSNETSNGSGVISTIDIWPKIYSNPSAGTSIIVANAKGKFRLKDNISSWQIQNIGTYGINFNAVGVVE